MKKLLLVTVTLAGFLAGCATSQMKVRKEQREKVSQASKLYCDFINGEVYPDVEVMLNLEMAKRCDADKNMTITQYRTTNENMGVIYCCSLVNKDAKKSEPATKPEVKPEPVKPELKSEAAKPAAAPAKPAGKTVDPANDDLGD